METTARSPQSPPPLRTHGISRQPIPAAAHRSTHATYDSVRRSYFWVNMYADIAVWTAACLTPAQRKPPRPAIQHDRNGLLWDPSPSATRATNISLSSTTLPRGTVRRLPSQKPMHAHADILINRVILEYAPPATILSDRGPHFNMS